MRIQKRVRYKVLWDFNEDSKKFVHVSEGSSGMASGLTRKAAGIRGFWVLVGGQRLDLASLSPTLTTQRLPNSLIKEIDLKSY